MISEKYRFKTKLELLEYYIIQKNNNLQTPFLYKTNFNIDDFELLNFNILKNLNKEKKAQVFEFIKNTNNLKILNNKYNNLKVEHFKKYNTALKIIINDFVLNDFAIVKLETDLILEILKVKEVRKTELIFSEAHLSYIDKILDCDKIVDYLTDVSLKIVNRYNNHPIQTDLIFGDIVNNYGIRYFDKHSLLILLMLIDKEKHRFHNIEDIDIYKIDKKYLEYVFNNYSFKNSYVENTIKLNLL